MRSDAEGSAFVGSGDEPEQQLGAGVLEGCEAELIDEDEVVAQQGVDRSADGSLEWVRAAENLCMIGPAGTGKSHILVAVAIAAVEAGHRVRYFTARADLRVHRDCCFRPGMKEPRPWSP